jgi:hypothetical protein
MLIYIRVTRIGNSIGNHARQLSIKHCNECTEFQVVCDIDVPQLARLDVNDRRYEQLSIALMSGTRWSCFSIRKP